MVTDSAPPVTLTVAAAAPAEVIDPTSGLWTQQPGESADEYRRFCVWLHGNRELPARDLKIAAQWDWTARATSFEFHLTGRGLTPKERLRSAAESLLDLFRLESMKMLVAAQSSKRATLKPAELMLIAKWFSEGLGHATAEGRSDELDDTELDQLSDTELAAIVDARNVITKLRGS